MTVVAALKFDTEISFGDATSQPQRRHRCLGAAGCEADHLHAGHHLNDQRSELVLSLRRSSE